MSLDDKTRKRIIEEETAKFLDPNFTNLDLSDYPQFNHPPMEESFIDERYGQLDTSGSGVGAQQLKAYLNNVDLEALEIAASETGNPDLVEEVQDQRAGAVSEEFIRRHPEYYGTDDNYEALLTRIARDAGIPGEVEAEDLFERGVFTLENLEKAYKRLLRVGQLEVRPGTLRELTEEQLQYCQLLCSRRDTAAAIANYVIFRLGKTAPSDVSESGGADAAYALLKKPEYRPLFEEACWWAFSQVSDYIESPKRRKFIEQYTRNKFVTVALLLKAWELCKAEEAKQTRNSFLFGNDDGSGGSGSEGTQPFDFDSLSDSQIETLKQKTLQQHAQNIINERRHRRGIK